MSIQANLKEVLSELPAGVRLVAVSKFHPNEALEEAYAAGQRIFGESHVQEMTQKYETLPKDIEWHFIGHLQTNKVKYMAPYVLQIHIAQEETKFGFSFDECREMLDTGGWKDLKNVRLSGVMGMATNVDDDEQIKREFCSLNTFFKEIKQNYFSDSEYFKEISMGMSHDYPLAVEAGSTLVRVGSKIFGERNY